MSETENHLIKLHNYLSKQLYNRPGAQCIRNELVTTYLRNNPEGSVGSFQCDRTCPRCLNVWNEGNFSIKSKSKKLKLSANKRVIIKCLICLKLCVIHQTSGKRGARWECTENQETAQNRDETSGKTQKRKFEATNASNAASSNRKRKISRVPSRANEKDCGNVMRKRASSEVLSESLKRKRKRRSKMTSKFNRTPELNACNVIDSNRKKGALKVLSDFL